MDAQRKRFFSGIIGDLFEGCHRDRICIDCAVSVVRKPFRKRHWRHFSVVDARTRQRRQNGARRKKKNGARTRSIRCGGRSRRLSPIGANRDPDRQIENESDHEKRQTPIGRFPSLLMAIFLFIVAPFLFFVSSSFIFPARPSVFRQRRRRFPFLLPFSIGKSRFTVLRLYDLHKTCW